MFLVAMGVVTEGLGITEVSFCLFSSNRGSQRDPLSPLKGSYNVGSASFLRAQGIL